MEAALITAQNPARSAAAAPAMEAVVQRTYGAPDTLRVERLPRPSPAPGQVVVEVRAAGLNRGVWHLMTGRPYLMRVMGFGFSRPKNPIAGNELAGVIVEVGAGVTRLKVGDPVFGIGEGALADFVVAREDKLALKPARLSFVEAATIGVSGLTALQALERAGSVRGARALIIGASGGVGTLLVQLAKDAGAEVTAVASGAKAALVQSLGADRVLDYKRQDFTAEATRYDVIFDLGGNTPLAALRRVLSQSGRVVFVGGENGGDLTAGFGRLIGALLLGIFVKQRFHLLTTKEHFLGLEALRVLVDTGKLRPVVAQVWPRTEIVAAMTALESGRIAGKAVCA
ncbi:MAG: NAD(P)-dependent alcohol dehydrogenase [Myxococcota bacterium]